MARSKAENNKCVDRDLVAPTEDSQSGMDAPLFHGVVHTLIIATCGKEWQQFASAPIVLRATPLSHFSSAGSSKAGDSCRCQLSPCFSRTFQHMGATPNPKTLIHKEEGGTLLRTKTRICVGRTS